MSSKLSDSVWDLFETTFSNIKRTDVVEVPNVYRHPGVFFVHKQDEKRWHDNRNNNQKNDVTTYEWFEYKSWKSNLNQKSI